jgi:hypothetical protein
MPRRVLVASAAVIAAAVAVWFVTQSADETTQIRRRLDALSAAVNASTTDGRGPGARAHEFGTYFTDDIEIDLGSGTAPILGRATLISMAERLQPRTAAFKLKFEDVTVAVGADGTSADVHLTAEFIRRDLVSGGQSLDAREFTLVMSRGSEGWQIRRVAAVDTLK